jgi:hypothetical protein
MANLANRAALVGWNFIGSPARIFAHLQPEVCLGTNARPRVGFGNGNQFRNPLLPG